MVARSWRYIPAFPVRVSLIRTGFYMEIEPPHPNRLAASLTLPPERRGAFWLEGLSETDRARKES